MKLNEIFEKSKGILSHAERDFYLAVCSFADNETGVCFPKIKTIAGRADVPQSSATRLMQKLEKLGFIMRLRDRVFCLVGFERISQESNFSSQESNLPTSQESNLISQESKPTSQESNSFINNYSITNQLTRGGTKTGLGVYREFYPTFGLTPYQENLLETIEIDESEFRECVKYWATNGYRENNLNDLLDCYQTEGYKPNHPEGFIDFNGKSPRMLADALKPYKYPKREERDA